MMDAIAIIQIGGFLIGSLGLVYVSRKSLLKLRSHGFYRFFAWWGLLALFFLNMKGWFDDPQAWHQLISWVLLLISLGLVMEGLRLLRKIGAENAARSDGVLLGMEKTANLVTVGLYRYIRHPLYCSLLFLGWGIFFKSPAWEDLGLAMLVSVFLAATARVEEQENLQYFGEAYRAYMKQTKRFVPFVY